MSRERLEGVKWIHVVWRTWRLSSFPRVLSSRCASHLPVISPVDSVCVFRVFSLCVSAACNKRKVYLSLPFESTLDTLWLTKLRVCACPVCNYTNMRACLCLSLRVAGRHRSGRAVISTLHYVALEEMF